MVLHSISNFRDVGEFINLLAGQPLLPEKRLLRGGSIDNVTELEDIASPATIINLRRGADRPHPGVAHLHIAAANHIENYDTAQAPVRNWLRQVIRAFENPQLSYPVLIHCASGKDRTGVVVAAILKILNVPETFIVDEYLLSEGEVDVQWIRQALAGIQPLSDYFVRIDLAAVRASILSAN